MKVKKLLIKIRDIFTQNFLLKIVSLIFAAVIWIAVVNVNDPMKTDTIRYIPVTVINDSLIKENNQTYTINGRMYVDVTVSGRRSVVTGLKTTDFVAVASMDEITVANTVPVKVEVSKSLERNVTIVSQSVSNLSVDIENIESRSFEIEATTTGEVASGFRLKEVTLVKKNVKITATTAILNKIEKVIAEVDLTDASEDFTEKYKIKLYDKSGNRIKTGEEQGVELSTKQVKAKVELEKLKTVPVVFELEGKPQSGYDITQTAVNPAEVTIAGDREIVNKVENITLSGDIVNVDGLNENREQEFNLYDYVTENFEILEGGQAKLTIEVEGDVYKEYSIKNDEVKLTNVPDGYDVSIIASQITITVHGKQQYISKVDSSKFKPELDCSDLDVSEGVSLISLSVTLPDGVSLERTVNVKVKCKEKEITTGG